MCYWGMYRAFTFNSGYAAVERQALEMAIKLRATNNLTERESLYITAESKMVWESFDAWNATMTLLNEQYPNDVDGLAFWLWGNVDVSVVIFGNPAQPVRSWVQQKIRESLEKFKFVVLFLFCFVFVLFCFVLFVDVSVVIFGNPAQPVRSWVQEKIRESLEKFKFVVLFCFVLFLFCFVLFCFVLL